MTPELPGQTIVLLPVTILGLWHLGTVTAA